VTPRPDRMAEKDSRLVDLPKKHRCAIIRNGVIIVVV
jgi:hypothetical protein